MAENIALWTIAPKMSMHDPFLNPSAIVVSAFNRLVQQTLSREIPLCWVTGEISGFTRAASGHWYFSLKDSAAQVRCVMFRGRNQFVDWQPANGQQVEVRATAGLFEPRGEFQLQVENLRQAGAGTLFEAFEQLKRKLAAEGLFDSGRKRPIPPLPRRIGVVTSPAGAALHDVLTTLQRLMPHVGVIVYPCQVQGNGSAAQITEALAQAGARRECDILLLCRGGGSMEDLWSFNDEQVARAIVASPIPVISGIGHETDFTIADFVADLRAPTPTAAASLCGHTRPVLQQELDQWQQRLQNRLNHTLQHAGQRLQWLAARLVHPGERLRGRAEWLQQRHQRLDSAWLRQLDNRQSRLELVAHRLKHARPEPDRQSLPRAGQALLLQMKLKLSGAEARLQTAQQHLQHLSPLNVLQRGYGIVRRPSGEIVRDATTLTAGERVDLQFSHGSAMAEIMSTNPDPEGNPPLTTGQTNDP